MQQLILVIHVLAAVALVVLALVQHGKGADMGASFGSGASGTMFGSVGPASFLMKLTAVFALVFFITSISLTSLVAVNKRHGKQLDGITKPATSLPTGSGRQQPPANQ